MTSKYEAKFWLLAIFFKQVKGIAKIRDFEHSVARRVAHRTIGKPDFQSCVNRSQINNY